MAITLSFGTAGIRAPLGEGDDELNPRTVRVVAHAVLEYAREVVPDACTRGICLAFDGRTGSAEFAREVCAVALAQGFRVRSFETPTPTPLLAFCTARHAAALGFMITASHNPPTDNGIKVYFQGGAQILPPHDAEIARRVARDIDPTAIPRLDDTQFEAARQRGDLLSLGEPEREAYLDAVLRLVPAATEVAPPRVAYSALCGVGTSLSRLLFQRAQVPDVHEVAAQAEPRADFGGLQMPNPEYAAALAELRALTEATGAELAFCHDPDADRLAVAVPTQDREFRILSGDEVGALLGDFLLSQAPDPTRQLLVSTLVSAELLQEIARARGARFEQTLTGFKWIAERARSVERASGLTFLFGYEEAIGYAFGSLGDDKDGVAALYVMLELAKRLRQDGRTLLDQLEHLARTHGLFSTRQVTLSAAGPQGKARMAEALRHLRETSPEAWLDPNASLTDFAQRSPRADLLVLRSEGARICVRPSGTEPKLKFYLQVRDRIAPEESFATAQQRAQRALDHLEAKLRTFTS